MNVICVVLFVMCKVCLGYIILILLIVGLVGGEFIFVYVVLKFVVEGWMELLCFEVEFFGIKIIIVESGFFCIDLLELELRIWFELIIDDYIECIEKICVGWDLMSGKQGGDLVKLGKVLIIIVSQEELLLCWIVGVDVIVVVEQKVVDF